MSSFQHLSGSGDLLAGDLKSLEATLSSDLLLELGHALLVASRVGRVAVQRPAEEAVGVVGLEVSIQDFETLAVVGDLGPVTLDVLQVTAEVGVGALEDLAVDGSAHDRLDVDELFIGLGGLRDDIVSGTLDGAHELLDLVLVASDEGVVGNVQDRAEAAAAQLSELVDAQHLDVVAGAALGGQPLFELDHLDVLETNTGVNVAADDGLGDVHTAADGSVVVRGHAVVFGELIDLNLVRLVGVESLVHHDHTYLAELANVSDSLSLERLEVGGDATALQVDNTSEGLVEEGTDRGNGEAAGLGLWRSQWMMHGTRGFRQHAQPGCGSWP